MYEQHFVWVKKVIRINSYFIKIYSEIKKLIIIIDKLKLNKKKKNFTQYYVQY